MLASRLVEITRAATVHLKNGVDKDVVFMWSVDTIKVHECLTMFAVAAKLTMQQQSMGGDGSGTASTAASTVRVLDACVDCLKAIGDGPNPVVGKWLYSQKEVLKEPAWKMLMGSFAELEKALL